MDRQVKEIAERLEKIDRRQDVNTANLCFDWQDAIKTILTDEENWALETAMQEEDTLKVFDLMQKTDNKPFDVLAKIRGYKNWNEYVAELEKGQYLITMKAKIKLIKIMQKGFFSDFDRKEIARLLDANKVTHDEE